MTPILVLLAAAASSAALTWAVRRYALARSILDVPNDRSAHNEPRPRGGGLAIAAVLLGGTILLGAAGRIAAPLAIALAGGGALIAVTGWLDDLAGLSPAIRAAIHFVAAIWAVLWLGGLPELTIGVGAVPLGGAGAFLAVIGIVWCINLYNFMDGIDGIASVEAVTAGGAAAVLLVATGAPDLTLASLLLAGASAGFLAWNWPPARIFMGDVGSGLLGFAFPVLAIASENAGALPLLAWIMLLGVFVVDATLTLVRRLLRREPVYTPHTRHAYQRATRAFGSHLRVTKTVLVLNLALAAAAALTVLVPGLLAPAFLASLLFLALLYRRVERLHPMWA